MDNFKRVKYKYDMQSEVNCSMMLFQCVFFNGVQKIVTHLYVYKCIYEYMCVYVLSGIFSEDVTCFGLYVFVRTRQEQSNFNLAFYTQCKAR
jgi:hypothetical protein